MNMRMQQLQSYMRKNWTFILELLVYLENDVLHQENFLHCEVSSSNMTKEKRYTTYRHLHNQQMFVEN
jgi:hypothetical protein